MNFSPQVALVRNLPNSFANCLKQETPSEAIDVLRAKAQHQQYSELLKRLGLRVIEVAADEALPDCCFIEDTAVVIGNKAAINFLGAAERRGEEKQVHQKLRELKIETHSIEAPGTVDGGDVLVTGQHLIVGLSARTNEQGARQLGSIFSDIPLVMVPVKGSLHLKSVLSAFDRHTLLFGQSAAARQIFMELDKICNLSRHYEIIFLPDDVAANVLSIGVNIVIQEGFPESEPILQELALKRNKKLHKITMSELIKADGALTCCSILI